MKGVFAILLAALLSFAAWAEPDVLELVEDREVQVCYRLPDPTRTVSKVVSPLPVVGQSRTLASGEVWHRERSDRICYYPDQKTFGEFQAVQRKLDGAQR